MPSVSLPVLVWGAGGHAAVVADILAGQPGLRIAGFVDEVDPEPRPLCGAQVLGGREQVALAAARGIRHAIVAIGQGDIRLARAGWLQDQGFAIITAVHRAAVVAASANLGPGTMVGAGAVVGVRAQLGTAVIVNTRAGVDHDCIIDDGAHVCPGVTLAGAVKVGRCAWIGAGATVIDGIVIGEGALVAAGAVVVEHVAPRAVVMGVPARVVRDVS